MADQLIIDEGDLRKYRTETPNIIDDLGLDPYERALYTHYKRVCGAAGGSCTESVRTTGKRTKMSPAKVVEARTSLKDRGLITAEQVKGRNGAQYRIGIVDVWELNFIYYATKKRPVIDGWTVAQLRAWCDSTYRGGSEAPPEEDLPQAPPSPPAEGCSRGEQTVHQANGAGSDCSCGEQSVHQANSAGDDCSCGEQTVRQANGKAENCSPGEQKNQPYGNQPSKKELSEKHAMLAALTDVCQIDVALVTEEQQGLLIDTAYRLLEAGKKPDSIAGFGAWWFANDWRGRRGQPPTPLQLREAWGQFERHGGTPAGQGNGGSGPPVPEYKRRRWQQLHGGVT